MSKFSSKSIWYICEEAGRFSVRRMSRDHDGKRKQERLDRNLYRQFETNREELNAFITRLNSKNNPGKQVRDSQHIEHAFMSVDLLNKFEAHLMESIPSENYVSGIMGRIINHFLHFFIIELRLKNPTDWHKVHKDKWSKYLNSEKLGLSPKSKRMIVQASNRFIAWLSERRNDIPKLVFEPISKAKFSTLSAEYDADETIQKPKMVQDTDWKIIKRSLPDEILPFVMLAYHYGLRRAETLAIEIKDIKNSYLSVERQLIELPFKTKILKGKASRKVPHWFCTPAETYEWISLAVNIRMVPDTLGTKWGVFIKTIGMNYTLHDFRHTWVTKGLREHLPRDVQLAAGHKNIETTMGYAHDDRNLDDAVFNPNKKAG